MEVSEKANTAAIKEIAHSYIIVCVSSPGSDGGELKNQDRVLTRVIEDDGCQQRSLAIVCDGLTQSPNSAEAAQHVSENVHRLYQEYGVQQLAGELLQKREQLIKTPLRLDHIESQVLKSMFADIVMEKRESSYQTTFISTCVQRDDANTGKLEVKVLGCGDSSLFVFISDGTLLFNTLGLADRDDKFEHLSPITKALPDNNDSIISHSLQFSDDVHLLLCSDGFYDSFEKFSDMVCWLMENRERLSQDAGKEEAVAELHTALCRKKGDDDISLIWLAPVDDRAGIEVGKNVSDADQAATPPERRLSRVTYAKNYLLEKLLSVLRWFRIIRGEESGGRAYD